MGRLMQHIIEEEENFWEDCKEVIADSETIQEFYGKIESLEKDGDIIRPPHISQERYQEEAEEYFNEYWSKFC
tara:strand:- start:283 stop:501 length:219 start_codon:yes stop_codon:yes gene_type:complete